tara:strand:- start:349 stop:564 length:216 start_codon:yes stop_codon:yes gene_type:complete
MEILKNVSSTVTIIKSLKSLYNSGTDIYEKKYYKKLLKECSLELFKLQKELIKLKKKIAILEDTSLNVIKK